MRYQKECYYNQELGKFHFTHPKLAIKSCKWMRTLWLVAKPYYFLRGVNVWKKRIFFIFYRNCNEEEFFKTWGDLYPLPSPMVVIVLHVYIFPCFFVCKLKHLIFLRWFCSNRAIEVMHKEQGIEAIGAKSATW